MLGGMTKGGEGETELESFEFRNGMFVWPNCRWGVSNEVW